MLAGAGEFELATSQFEAAHRLTGELAHEHAAKTRMDLLIDSQIKMAVVLNSQKKHVEAENLLINTKPLMTRQMENFPNDTELLDRRAWLSHNLGDTLVGQGKHQQAAEHYQDAIVDRERMIEETADNLQDTDIHERLIESRMNFAVCQMSLGSFKEAASGFRLAIDGLRNLIDQDPNDTRKMLTIAATYLNLSNLSARKDPALAVDDCECGIEWADKVYSAFPESHDAAKYLAMLHGNCALFRMQSEETETSLNNWLAAEKYAVDQNVAHYCRGMWIRALIELGRFKDAESALNTLDLEEWSLQNRFSIADNWATLAVAIYDQHSENDTSGAIENALAMMQRLKVEGFLKDNESVKKHVMFSDDFELIRER